VVAIMVIITTVFLLRQQQFNSSTLLRSLAYSVALSVRQAQVYGTSAKIASLSFSSPQCAPTLGAPTFGLYFNAADLSHYLLFADTNCNGQYDPQYDPRELIQTFTLGNGYTMHDWCVYTTQTDKICASTNPALSWVTIVFRRPNPEACIASSIAPGACASGAVPVYTSAYLQFVSQGGSTRSVSISSTGQVVVGQAGS